VKYVGLVDEDSYFNGLDQEAIAEVKEIIINRLNEEHNCIPIFVSKSQVCYFYTVLIVQQLVSSIHQLSNFHTFCKRVLWPIFHSLPIREALSNDTEWNAYCEVSAAIAEAMRTFVKVTTGHAPPQPALTAAISRLMITSGSTITTSWYCQAS